MYLIGREVADLKRKMPKKKAVKKAPAVKKAAKKAPAAKKKVVKKKGKR